jgi:hypothetical protein
VVGAIGFLYKHKKSQGAKKPKHGFGSAPCFRLVSVPCFKCVNEGSCHP